MKLTQFDADVNKNVTNARVSPAGDMISFGADTKGSQALIGAIGAAGDLYQKQWMKNENDKIIDATNEYNRRIDALMNDEKTGLYIQNQGKNAENIQNLYEQEEKKIRENIIKEYGIDSEYATTAFNTDRDKSVTGYLHDISLYQRKEADKYADTQNAGIWENVSNTSLRNPQMTVSLFEDGAKKTMAIFGSRGIDKETAEQKIQALKNNAAASILESDMITGDYTQGQNFLAYFKTQPGANMSMIKKYENAFALGKMKRDTSRQVSEWVHKTGINLTNMTDEEATEKYLEENPVSLSGMISGNSSEAGSMAVNQALNGYGEGESWMGAVTDDPTIQCDSWTADAYKKAGLNLDPDNNGLTQPADFGAAYHYDIDNYELKPGDWLEGNFHVGIYLGDGKVRARNSTTGVTTMTLEEFENLTNSKGNVNGLIGVGSVSEFAQNNGYAAEGMSEEQKLTLNEERRNKVNVAIISEKQNQLEYIRNAISGIKSNLQTMGANGRDLDSQIDYVHSQVDGDPLLRDAPQTSAILNSLKMEQNAMKSRQLVGNNYAGGSPTAGRGTIDALIANIQSGDIRSEQELQQVIAQTGPVSPSQYQKLISTLENTMNGKDIEINVTKEEIQNSMNGMQISAGDLKMAKTLARRKSVLWSQEHDGIEPNEWQKRDFVIQSLTEDISVGRNKYNEVSEMKSNILNILSTGDPDYKTVVFKDGKSYDVYIDDVEELLKGTKTEADIQFTREGGMM